MNEFISIDVETTGLNPYSGRIVELGAVRFLENGNEVSRFHSLVHPMMEIPEDAIRIHGITDLDVQGQPLFPEVLRNFVEFIYTETPGVQSTYYIAHNAPFDVQFINQEIIRNFNLIPDRFEIDVIDTLDLSRRTRRASHKLVDLVNEFKIEKHGFHRSISDCVYLKQIWFKLNGPHECRNGKLRKHTITSKKDFKPL